MLTKRGSESASTIANSKKSRKRFHQDPEVSSSSRSEPVSGAASSFNYENASEEPRIPSSSQASEKGKSKSSCIPFSQLQRPEYAFPTKCNNKEVANARGFDNKLHIAESSVTQLEEESRNVEEAFSSLLFSKNTRFDSDRTKKTVEVACEQDTWEVILLLDHRETVSRRDSSAIFAKILQYGIKCEQRALSVGDVMWVARRHRKASEGLIEVQDFVLDSIVERKTVDDLCVSIIDKRFIEQKNRLAKCGLKNVIYLVEGSQSTQTTTGHASLVTAMAMTSVRTIFEIL